MTFFIKPELEKLKEEAEHIHPHVASRVFDSLLIELEADIVNPNKVSALQERYFQAILVAKRIIAEHYPGEDL